MLWVTACLSKRAVRRDSGDLCLRHNDMQMGGCDPKLRFISSFRSTVSLLGQASGVPIPISTETLLLATTFKKKKKKTTEGQWHTPLIPAPGRQRQADREFEASLVCRASSRTARDSQRNIVSEQGFVGRRGGQRDTQRQRQ